MSLTSLLPTLRPRIPSPFTRDLWPAGAVPAVDDVTVTGISALRYTALCGTPCVMTGNAVIPLSGGVASATETTAVLTVSVVAVGGMDAATPAAGILQPAPTLMIDAALERVRPRWQEARLIGRVSDAYDRRYAVADAAGLPAPGVAVILPGDLAPGDLVTVPCAGGVAVGDVRTAVV